MTKEEFEKANKLLGVRAFDVPYEEIEYQEYIDSTIEDFEKIMGKKWVWENKPTLVVNLFAGPGAGKSTGAAYIFSRLKLDGVDSEYVTEFAKDKVWEDNSEVFKSQFYISGKQAFKIQRCVGKVDVIVTDSPVLTGAFYTESDTLRKLCLEEFQKTNNLNFFIDRVKKYNPNGRHQSEEQAKEVDVAIKDYLKKNDIEFTQIRGDAEGYDNAILEIKKVLETL